tara:strand:- start:17 stop:715 length:699 start_codon:yes stop_codon:yes gene_type:complete
MRLNKYLSQAGVASRRKSDELIKMATTTVNGEICLDPAYDVKTNDIISYENEKVIIKQEKIVLMFHKPKKVITTLKDTHGRKTVVDYIPLKTRLRPVGRLDQNTTGLLLMTNDGELQDYLTHPKNQISKDYEAIIEGKISQAQIKKIKNGIYIGNNEYGRAEVIKYQIQKGRSFITLRLRRGKKREIRRIFYRLKIKLISLKRIAISNLKLGALDVGAFRLLKKNEIAMLRK